MMFFNFQRNYKAQIPHDILNDRGSNKVIGETGKWCSFYWSYIPQREYVEAPDGWLDISKLKGSDLLVSGVAKSEDGNRIIKVEFFRHYRKRNDLKSESEIINKLNESGCASAPKLLDVSVLPLESIKTSLPEDQIHLLLGLGVTEFRYMILEYVVSTKEVPIADIVVSMLEQKSLGVYHGDIKPDNIRFNSDRGICVLIDYDQARLLSTDVQKLNAEEFLRWCDVEDKKTYPRGKGSWRRHFKGLSHRYHIKPLIRYGAFDLAKTTPYKRQATTNTKKGVYHTISHPVVFADGVRDLKARSSLLDKLDFEQGEAVLDVGCNAGLLVHYLARRGCCPTGIELDQSMVIIAKMIANIIGVNADFESIDLDKIDSLEQFDTVCLFSVIHHTKKLEENGEKIARSCKRIIIECRLSEHGKKPVMTQGDKVKWVRTSVWDYAEEKELFDGLIRLFPGFNIITKIGSADKARMILEMKKY